MKKSQLEILLKETVKQGTIAKLEIAFNGKIYENSEGIFKGSYIDVMDKKLVIKIDMKMILIILNVNILIGFM